MSSYRRGPIRLARYSYVLLTMLLSALPGAEPGPLRIEIKTPTVKTREFDPRKPPADLPKMEAGESAWAECYLGIQVHMNVMGQRARGEREVYEFQVTEIQATTTLDTTIWLPKDADAWLKAHEDGHRRIGEHYYQGAEAAVRRVAGAWIGRQLTGRGRDRDAACKAAIDEAIKQVVEEYLAAVRAPSQQAQEAYDRITDHGRNRRVTAAEGVRRAIEEVAAGRKAK